MEEVEALSDRIAILINGSLKCLGTSRRLKTSFGAGWKLTVKCLDSENARKFADWAINNLASSLEHYSTLVHRRVGCTVILAITRNLDHQPDAKEITAVLSDVFQSLASAQGMFFVTDHELEQTTLAQVFLEMVSPTVTNKTRPRAKKYRSSR